jgi:hypothetical protein
MALKKPASGTPLQKLGRWENYLLVDVNKE